MSAILNEWGLQWILLGALGVSFIIAFHELGHYALARLLNMRVVRFSVGLGPKLVSFRRSGIEYQIAAIPFGGFVQIFGMTPIEEGAYEDPKSFINQPRWARIIVYLAGPAFNYILAAFLFFCAFWFYPGGDIVVSHVVPETAAAEAGLKSGDEIISVNGRPLLSSEDFSYAVSQGKPLELQVIHDAFRADFFDRQSAMQKFIEANEAIAKEADDEELRATAEAKVKELEAKVKEAEAAVDVAIATSAAKNAATEDQADALGHAEPMEVTQARLKLAQAQKALNDFRKPREQLAALTEATRKALKARIDAQQEDPHAGRSAEVINVTPRVTETGAQLGVIFFFEIDEARTPSFFQVAAYSVTICWTQSVGTLRALSKIFVKDSGVKVSGPVGITKALAQAAEKGLRDFLKLIALLSLTLGLFNLLPIPALDGIKILFLSVESVARRDLFQTAQLWVNAIGLLVLLALIFGITIFVDIFG